MPALFRLFTVQRPQKIAGVLLLVFLLECFYVITTRPLNPQESETAFAGRRLWSGAHSKRDGYSNFDESIFAVRAAGLLSTLQQKLNIGESEGRIYANPNRVLARLPFVLFGLWLGAALWWVARRLYGDEGGYVALTLYCFSPAMVLYSSRIRSDIFVAWGVFGLIFTAIGVAHTLYAPPRMWKVRILILGAALGITAAANFLAAVIGLIFALIFILYLAPGRRLVGIGVLALSCIFGALVCWALYGFHTDLLESVRIALLADSGIIAKYLSHPSTWIFLGVYLLCVGIYFAWPRTRYFGNTAPMIVSCVLFLLLPGGYLNGSGNTLAFPLWAIPFACIFIGGIFADLLDRRFAAGRYSRYIRGIEVLVLVANAALCALAIHQGARSWLNI